MRLATRSVFVIAGLVALAIAGGACQRDTAAPSGRAALAAAVATNLPFRARLAGGFAPSSLGPTRAAGDRAPELSPDTRIAIALLEKRAMEHPTPEAQADLGVGYLIQGDIDRAIATIEDAALQLAKPDPWSDLSAAYLAKAERAPSRRLEYLARALEAAEKSLRIARTNEALFNRAMARDGLAPFTGSAAPWSDYSAAETDPAWREFAAQQAADDKAVQHPNERWLARRQELSAKLTTRDTPFVNDTARLFPEATMELLEQDMFVDPAAIDHAALLAMAIHGATRDPMANDEVSALKASGAPLIAAHRDYAAGVELSNANKIPEARTAFEKALSGFSRTRAPYRAWAETRLAYLDWQEGRFDAAQRTLAKVETEARGRNYATLLGRVLWQRGMAFTRQWELTDALAAFREGASCYEAANEREYAVSLYSNLADTLRMLGESNQSWEFIGRTLEDLDRVRRPGRRYLLLYNATLFARRQELTEAALLFQDAAVREAAKANPGVLVEATIQRALVHIHRGDDQRAAADLDEAARQLASTPPGAFRSYMSAERDIARAQLRDGGVEAAAGLRSAIDFFKRTEPGRVPGLYLLLARTRQARSSPEMATQALQAGIDRLEVQQAGLGDEALRISYFDESWGLFREMLALQVAAKNPAKAFEYAERSRARSLLATAQGVTASRTRSLTEIQSRLPSGILLVHYSTTPDRVLIWHVTSTEAKLAERRITERELTRLVAQHRAAIQDRRGDDSTNRRLYDLLIEPIAGALPSAASLVLVPDAQLQQVSFATLRNPTTRRYLIEDQALLVSPSATFFVDARVASAGREAGPASSALLVGNPAAGGVRSLPGAEAEVAAVSTAYARREVLTGRTATKGRFLEMAPRFDVIHFGGHAYANSEFPLLSRMVFADESGSEQSLFAHEIARLRFPRTRVVVLAACSTAAGTASRGEGVVSVARPFLGGGVPVVIASQWDVDDRATEQLTSVLHHELAKSGDPIRALQAAQLKMLRSGDTVQALPLNWGAFIAIGTSLQ